MRHYVAIVNKDPESAFGLSFPDLPGCFAAADEWDGIIAAAAKAIDQHFAESGAVPARGVDEIRRLPDVQQALSHGATLLVVPYMWVGDEQVLIDISIDRALLRAIDEAAAARDMTRSAFLEALARKEIAGA